LNYKLKLSMDSPFSINACLAARFSLQFNISPHAFSCRVEFACQVLNLH
jgi:hypothetical protein